MRLITDGKCSNPREEDFLGSSSYALNISYSLWIQWYGMQHRSVPVHFEYRPRSGKDGIEVAGGRYCEMLQMLLVGPPSLLAYNNRLHTPTVSLATG